jgi:hypothetical protein
MRLVTRVVVVSTAVGWLGAAAPARAQNLAGIGTRALGMAGAYTAVADDASAVYWNPAGTATGALASLVVDWSTHESARHDDDRSAPAVRGSGTLIALTLPVIGIGYYRLDTARAGPVATAGAPGHPAGTRVAEALITDHLAVTLAQTLAGGLHVGVALKAVRGRAAQGTFDGGVAGPDGAMEAVEDRVGDADADTRFDVDLGVMLDLRTVRLGLGARNLTRPSFPTTAAAPGPTLPRLARAGVALLPRERLLLALDADLTERDEVDGRWRHLGAGTEVWSRTRRFGVRGGVSVQTIDAARPAGSLGASVAVGRGLSLDGQVTGGSRGAERGWSLGGRFTY